MLYLVTRKEITMDLLDNMFSNIETTEPIYLSVETLKEIPIAGVGFDNSNPYPEHEGWDETIKPSHINNVYSFHRLCSPEQHPHILAVESATHFSRCKRRNIVGACGLLDKCGLPLRTMLRLIPEPLNQYDANAVGVWLHINHETYDVVKQHLNTHIDWYCVHAFALESMINSEHSTRTVMARLGYLPNSTKTGGCISDKVVEYIKEGYVPFITDVSWLVGKMFTDEYDDDHTLAPQFTPGARLRIGIYASK